MYRQVLALDPDRPGTHYNMGLIYKYQGKWQESFSHNKRATELCSTDEATNWNLGIAATALRDWRTARDVWKRLGIDVEAGDRSIESNFGIAPVRLNPDDGGEVVWSRRIDPVRASITSVPYASSGYRRGDVVLHDGAPVGYRKFDDREYPVFNVLALFEHSKLSTYEAEVRATDASDIQALTEAFDKTDVACEDWTTSVRQICKQCSEGRPHEHHDDERRKEWVDRHVIGIAAHDDAVCREILRRWAKGRREVLSFELTLSPPVHH